MIIVSVDGGRSLPFSLFSAIVHRESRFPESRKRSEKDDDDDDETNDDIEKEIRQSRKRTIRDSRPVERTQDSVRQEHRFRPTKGTRMRRYSKRNKSEKIGGNGKNPLPENGRRKVFHSVFEMKIHELEEENRTRF